MNRRTFIKVAAGVAAVPFLPASMASGGFALEVRFKDDPRRYFDTILAGFLTNAKATSADYTVCDFREGTKLAGTLTPSKKSYVGVARMLPAMAEYVVGHKGDGSVVMGGAKGVDLNEVMLSIYRTAFDPGHPDYWGEPVKDRATQRTVESSLVALALARLGPGFVGKLSAGERANVNKWLASCTVVPERTNNHAWFTAVNQAARLKLGKTFPEFKGDEKWMLDDLDAMEVLAANAADGWYSDDPKLTVYDYYNFWTFGNFPLFWSSIAGDLYPERNGVLLKRSKAFLENTPYFFGSDGAVPLFGRSLLYRWALLSPMLVGYQQGIWPHSPGLLRRIVRLNMGWWWNMGAYDEKLGKLRETLSERGTKSVTENYIDNGHPYWCMQGMSYLSIPEGDPFWMAEEEALPVERGDFVVRIAGPKMVLRGTRSSGQVRWLQAVGTPRRPYYRDKYNKFVAASGFGFNVVDDGRKEVPFAPTDQNLLFLEKGSGKCASRVFPDGGEMAGGDGVRTTWSAKLPDGRTARVVSTVRLLAEDFEWRSHEITFEEEADPKAEMEICEGSSALGFDAAGPVVQNVEGGVVARSSTSGHVVGVFPVTHREQGVMADRWFDPEKRTAINLVYAKQVTLTRRIPLPKTNEPVRVATLFYASPKGMGAEEIGKRVAALKEELKS